MIQKKWKFFEQKGVNIKKQAHAFKIYASSYTVEILNSFNAELQLKDTESAIKSKLIDLLTQLKSFKFVTTLVLVLNKIEHNINISIYNPFWKGLIFKKYWW